MSKLRAVLFDLDGTLLDTAPDMVGALDLLRAEQGLGPVDYDYARAHVSNGALGLIKIAFGELDEDRRLRLRDRYLALYESRLATATLLFDGMEAVLEHLEFHALVSRGRGSACEAVKPVEMSRIHRILHGLKPVTVKHGMDLDPAHPVLSYQDVVVR